MVGGGASRRPDIVMRGGTLAEAKSFAKHVERVRGDIFEYTLSMPGDPDTAKATRYKTSSPSASRLQDGVSMVLFLPHMFDYT